MKNFCIADGLTEAQQEEVDHYISNARVVKAKDHLFLEGHKIKNIYAIYSGMCKEYKITKNNNEVISEFYFPGDIIGLDSSINTHFQSNAVALCDSTVCLIPKKIIFSNASNSTNLLHTALFKLLCQKIKNMHSFYMTTNVKSRVAAFYINTIERHFDRYPKVPHISLPISHKEISNRIGIANETLSRVLLDFDQLNILKLQHGDILYADLDALKALLP